MIVNARSMTSRNSADERNSGIARETNFAARIAPARSGDPERPLHLVDRLALGLAHALAAEPEDALPVGLRHVLGDPDDELLVLLGLLWRGFAPEQRRRIPQVLERVLLELLRRVVAGVVHLGLGRRDLVEQLRLSVASARLGVGLGDREGLAERAAPLGGGDHQARARRPAQDQLPLLGGEVFLTGHGP